MSTRSVIRHERWTLEPDLEPDAEATTYAMQCAVCEAASDTDEDFADPQNWALNHSGRNPSHHSYREITTQPWRTWMHTAPVRWGFDVGDVVWDDHARRRGVVTVRNGGSVRLSGDSGQEWITDIDSVATYPTDLDPDCPAGAVAMKVGPDSVRIGDRVRVQGQIHAVHDLRPPVNNTSRTLVLPGHGDWTMNQPRIIYRPLTPPPATP
ncbi:hypothetical protein ACIQNU_11495 [Streptomyces sp. NPDC091292]|uniref:DUF7848 domain-containing protein n=1 Tax=Streptomyces sp. NPDC091292 TaxID=3365991 RepID=UPI0038226919